MKVWVLAALAVLASARIAGAQPAPSGISVDRARAQIALGSVLTINVAGARGPLDVHVPFAGVDAAYDARARRLQLTGRAPASGTITLTDALGNSAAIGVLVAPAAGTLPADVDVALAGTVSNAFATARIRDAVERATVRRPGTALDIHGVTLPATLAPGDALDAQAGVSIGGNGTYVDVSGRVNLHVHVDPGGAFDPLQLFYSDDPEYVPAQAAGLLFYGTLDAQTPARIFAYHVAAGGPRQISLVLRSAVPSHVRVLGTISGASPAYTYIGQQSSARFLAARASGESAVVALAPDVPYEIPFAPQQPGDLVEAIADLRVLDGGPVEAMIATRPGTAPAPALEDPELAGDGHGRRGVFALNGAPPLDLAFTSDGPEPSPVAAGDIALPNERSGGRPLAGDYGVVRRLTLHLANASAAPLTVYLYELTSGAGGATATFLFDGDATATQVPCVDDAVQPHLVKAFALNPSETRTVGATFMTDGASSYPIRFGLTATPPAPPPANACLPPPPN